MQAVGGIILSLFVWWSGASNALGLVLPHDRDGVVLIVHSYNAGYGWTDLQHAGIVEELSQSAPNIEPFAYYLDARRDPEPSSFDRIEDLIRHRHPRDSVRAIVSTDDAALRFALKLRRDAYASVPVIHGGVVPTSAKAMTAGETGVYGVPESRDYAGTVRMALAANPALRQVYFIRDRSETGLGLETAMREELGAADLGLDVQVLGDSTLDALGRRLSVLPKDSVVLFGTHGGDDARTIASTERSVELLSERSSVPVYALQNRLLGHGIVGGSLLSGTDHGRAVAALAAAAIQGFPRGIPEPDRRKSLIRALDYQQMARFGLDIERIPDVELVINKPFSFLQTYKLLVIGVGTVIACLTAVLLVLAAVIRQRMRAEAALSETNLALTRSRQEIDRTLAELTECQVRLADSEQQLTLVVEASRDVIWSWDFAKDKRSFTGRMKDLLGYESADVDSYANWCKLLHPEDKDRFEEVLRRCLARETENYSIQYRVRHADGLYRWIQASAKVLFDEAGRPTIAAGSYTDITEDKLREERLDRLAHHDTLTGLPNRAKVAEHVDQIINSEKTQAGGQSLALLFLDMDNFKVINDSFGHRAGDDLLIEFGNRIQHHAASGLFVSRLGGDEFVVVVQGSDAYEISEVVGRLERSLKTPFLIAGQEFFISCSIGIARYPWDGRDFDELLQNADTAMYWAKDNGRNRVCSFSREMNRDVVDRVRLLSRARHALDHHQFSLVYQPKVATTDGRVLGFEALVRWTDAELGPVSPARFIPVFEDSGLILPLGLWILDTACTEAAAINRRSGLRLCVGVNVSVVQLTQPEFVQQVLAVLEKSGLAPELLELEITESRVIGSFDETTRKLRELREAGVRIALDDFGTGYSSLTYLRQLPIDTLKLDKSFIDDVHNRPDARSMVTSIARIAGDLSYAVVAEGVESREQWEILARIGCDVIQGYLVSAPLPADRIDDFLKDWTRRSHDMPRRTLRSDVVVELNGRS